MSRIRVIGMGSPFGDDRLGWSVIELLQHKSRLQSFIPQDLQLMACDRPGMLLLEFMRGADTVFIIDAVKSGAKPGTLHQLKTPDTADFLLNSQSTHSIGLADAIRMGEILQELPKNLYLYCIEINEVHLEAELLKPIKQAVHLLSKQLENLLLPHLFFRQ